MKRQEGTYTLYLDESKMRIGQKGEEVYCVAGVIISSDDIHDVRRRMKELKTTIWNHRDEFTPAPAFRSIHQTEVRNPTPKAIQIRPYMQVFKSRENKKKVFDGLEKIIDDFSIYVMGAVVNEKRLTDIYGSHQDSYTAYYAALKVIVENYALFLRRHGAHGRLLLESRANAQGNISDARVKKSFYKIMSNGTLRYSALELQQLVQKIDFSAKSQNDAGIQIADYVPRAFLYNYTQMPQPKPSIYQTLRKHRYNGDSADKTGFSKYGVVLID